MNPSSDPLPNHPSIVHGSNSPFSENGPTKVTVDVLDTEHYRPLVRAIHNITRTDLAEITFAQLIDGLPIVDTVWDMRGTLVSKGHPLISHDRLCDGAMERLRAFRDLFDLIILTFDSPVGSLTFEYNIIKVIDGRQAMQRYQNAIPGSR